MKEDLKNVNKDISIKEKIEKVILKMLFPLEFIFSILLVYFLYNIIVNKSYFDIWLLNHLVGFIVASIIVISLIIFNYLKNRGNIEKIFLSFLIPVGIMYLVFITPTYVPDENAHIWKSYEISEGKIITPLDEEGNSHTDVPEFLRENTVSSVDKYYKLNDLINEDTDYTNTEQVVNPAQNYPPILYVFSSIGLFIGRVFGMNGILAEYLASMMNYIVFLICAYYSVKLIPFGKLFISAFLFIPMILQQATSVSADSLLNSVLIFYVAYNMYLLFKEDKINKKEKIAYVFLSIFVGLAKIVYVPLIGLSLLFIGSKNIDKKNKKIVIISSIVLGVVISVGWYVFSMKYTANEQYLIENNVNAIEQIKGVITNPIHGVKVILRTLYCKAEMYLFTMVGSQLGWLNISIPQITIVGFILIPIMSIFFENNENSLDKKQRIWMIIVSIVSVALILMALYAGWTSVGASIVEGIQGRYFIPIIILPLLCLCMKNNYVKVKNIELYIPIILTILNLSVINSIIRFFI